MGSNKYAEELENERNIIIKNNPFSKMEKRKNNFTKGAKESVPFIKVKDKNANYFSLLLDPDYEDLELKVRGLRAYKEKDNNGKEILITRKIPNHYLSDEGAEDILSELTFYLGSDMKLGVLTKDEYLGTMNILRKFIVSYISNNLYKLGMDTEEKQRKSPMLINMILIKIRQVLSRSVSGKENERSHGDIKLSGELDFNKEERFKMEDIKN